MSIFTDDERENSNGLEWFGDYHRWGIHQNSGGNWDNYDPYSKKILELKENNSSAESYFFNRPFAKRFFDALVAPAML